LLGDSPLIARASDTPLHCAAIKKNLNPLLRGTILSNLKTVGCLNNESAIRQSDGEVDCIWNDKGKDAPKLKLAGWKDIDLSAPSSDGGIPLSAFQLDEVEIKMADGGTPGPDPADYFQATSLELCSEIEPQESSCKRSQKLPGFLPGKQLSFPTLQDAGWKPSSGSTQTGPGQLPRSMRIQFEPIPPPASGLLPVPVAVAIGEQGSSAWSNLYDKMFPRTKLVMKESVDQAQDGMLVRFFRNSDCSDPSSIHGAGIYLQKGTTDLLSNVQPPVYVRVYAGDRGPGVDPRTDCVAGTVVNGQLQFDLKPTDVAEGPEDWVVVITSKSFGTDNADEKVKTSLNKWIDQRQGDVKQRPVSLYAIRAAETLELLYSDSMKRNPTEFTKMTNTVKNLEFRGVGGDLRYQLSSISKKVDEKKPKKLVLIADAVTTEADVLSKIWDLAGSVPTEIFTPTPCGALYEYIQKRKYPGLTCTSLADRDGRLGQALTELGKGD
jgi:hypothetical protein